MRYSQLRAFHHVARLGGFSRAAEALLITQPAISEQVRKLETDHDVLLFHRDRRKVRLTRAGEELFRMTKQFFETEWRRIGMDNRECKRKCGRPLRPPGMLTEKETRSACAGGLE